MQTFPSNSVDCGCTDPPYGYSFMGKDWDKAVPSVAVWRECLRVLKPGAFMFVMSSPRADVLSQMIIRLGEAGFRTDFSPIYWTYANGYPKAANAGVMIDRQACRNRLKESLGRSPTKDEMKEAWKKFRVNDEPVLPRAKELQTAYLGFQPKPAVEVIIVSMKPFDSDSFVNHAIETGKGLTWLDDCRIPFEDTPNPATNPYYRVTNGYKIGKNPDKNPSAYTVRTEAGEIKVNSEGRFPANLLVSDDILNDGKKRKSGTIPAGEQTTYGDSGSFSRYFDLDYWFEKQIKKLPLEVQKTFPFVIVNKASREERNFNLKRNSDGTYANMHPTVKPLTLMTYLLTLGSRPNDLVIDNFCGTGTTCLAAKMLGRRYIGIDSDKMSVELAQERTSNHKTLSEFFTPEIASFNPLKMTGDSNYQ